MEFYFSKYLRICKDWLFDTHMDLLNRHYDSSDIKTAIAKDVKIFVFQHKPGHLPECFADRRIYIPIQGGRIVNAPITSILGDDQGENISAFNVQLNEMTCIYWLGKHYADIGSPAFIGFGHYRRFLEWDANKLESGVLFASSYLLNRPVLRYFKRTRGNVDDAFDAFLSAFNKNDDFSEYHDIAKYCKQHITYCCNLLLTDKNTFMRYFCFIEKCIALCIKLIELGAVNVSGPRFEDKRKFGYVLEFMTGYWIWHENRAGRINVIRACKQIYF